MVEDPLSPVGLGLFWGLLGIPAPQEVDAETFRDKAEG